MGRKRILLIEDDLLLADQLARKLTKWGYEVVAQVRDVQAAQQAFQRFGPDLLLVDIVLEGSAMDGIAIAERLCRTQQVPVVFLSSVQDKALLQRASQLAHCVFVPKQGGDAAVQTNIEWALRSTENVASAESAVMTLEVGVVDEDSFFVKVANRRVRIVLDQVVYLEAGRSTTTIYLLNGKKYCSAVQFGDFLRRLNRPNKILRIHRSHAVNLKHIAGLDGRQVCIALPEPSGEIKLPIGESYFEGLRERLNYL